MLYYVTEIQSGATGAVIPFVFDNLPEAEAKYHSLLSVAALSNVPKHGAMLFTEDSFVTNHEVYVHPAPVEVEE